MGNQIGAHIYGMRDHTGRIHHMHVVPNARNRDTVAHLYLDFVDAYDGAPIQLTVDGGTEVGLMVAAQTALR